MSSPADDAGPRGDGIGALLELARSGHPDDALPLREILGDLQDSAFGMFLLIAVIPSFIPIPGVAGAISGPLVMLIGAQMLAGLRRPWLPGPIGRRGPRRRTLARFVGAASRWLDRLDRLLEPRLASLTGAAGRHVSGLLLVLLGLLLALPIPFTNYLFGLRAGPARARRTGAAGGVVGRHRGHCRVRRAVRRTGRPGLRVAAPPERLTGRARMPAASPAGRTPQTSPDMRADEPAAACPDDTAGRPSRRNASDESVSRRCRAAAAPAKP